MLLNFKGYYYSENNQLVHPEIEERDTLTRVYADVCICTERLLKIFAFSPGTGVMLEPGKI